MTRRQAILLFGPTGSGKTPLGEMIEKRGLGGRRCIHFDFGAQLRSIANGAGSTLTHGERDVVKKVLDEGRLLLDREFPVARKILLSFIPERSSGDVIIILNGLPRHEGQARDISDLLEITGVVYLDCDPEVVVQRIALNTGGDRKKREDDAPDAVRKRLADFREKIRPMLEYYCQKVPVDTIQVGVEDTAEDLYRILNKRLADAKKKPLNRT